MSLIMVITGERIVNAVIDIVLLYGTERYDPLIIGILTVVQIIAPVIYYILTILVLYKFLAKHCNEAYKAVRYLNGVDDANTSRVLYHKCTFEDRPKSSETETEVDGEM